MSTCSASLVLVNAETNSPNGPITRPVSPLTRNQWLELSHKANIAREALSELSLALAQAAKAVESDAELSKSLVREFCHVNDINFLGGYWYFPQSEWTGGDSLDPKNFVEREPHICGMRRWTVTD